MTNPTISAVRYTAANVQRRDVRDLGYSVIEDAGEIDLTNGKLLYFIVQRFYDRRATKGSRVSYEVELRKQHGHYQRVVDGDELHEVRQELIERLLARIEADNRKTQDDQWYAAFGKPETTVEHPEVPAATQGQPKGEPVEDLWVEAYGKVSGTTKVIPLTTRHLQAVADFQEQGLKDVLAELKDGKEVNARVVRFRLTDKPAQASEAPLQEAQDRSQALAKYAQSRNALSAPKEPTKDEPPFYSLWRTINSVRSSLGQPEVTFGRAIEAWRLVLA